MMMINTGMLGSGGGGGPGVLAFGDIPVNNEGIRMKNHSC